MIKRNFTSSLDWHQSSFNFEYYLLKIGLCVCTHLNVLHTRPQHIRTNDTIPHVSISKASSNPSAVLQSRFSNRVSTQKRASKFAFQQQRNITIDNKVLLKR